MVNSIGGGGGGFSLEKKYGISEGFNRDSGRQSHSPNDITSSYRDLKHVALTALDLLHPTVSDIPVVKQSGARDLTLRFQFDCL